MEDFIPNCPHCSNIELIFDGIEDVFGCELCGRQFHNNESMTEFTDDEYNDFDNQ
jgi:hypothetical protein